MKNRKKIGLAMLAGLLALVMLLGACATDTGTPNNSKQPTGTKQPATEESTTGKPEVRKLKLTEFEVIYAANVTAKTKQAAELLAGALGKTAKSDTAATGAQEILVGVTNRGGAVDLSAKKETTAFDLRMAGEKLVISGKNENSLVYGVKYLMGTVIERDGGELPADYTAAYATDNKVTVFDNLSVLDVGTPSVIYGANLQNMSAHVSYPRVIVLEHNGENNGMMLATLQSLEVKDVYRILRSTDGGGTWQEIAQIKNKMHGAMLAGWQPTIYELPRQVGDMPAGTLLFSGCVRRPNGTDDLITTLCVWKSTDLGKSWEHISDVADSYLSKGGNGVWEPVFDMTDDGTLVCLYSDENDKKNHSQTLLGRTTRDGIRCSEPFEVVSLPVQSLRPGMVSVVRLNNGKYFATYEIVGMFGGPIHYRTSDSLTNWGDTSKSGTQLLDSVTRIGMGTSPAVGYAPNSGNCGMLFIAGEHRLDANYDKNTVRGSDLFVSLDYGKTWTAIDNPMPYHLPEGITSAQGYSSNFFTCADGHTVWFSQSTDWDYPTYGNKTSCKLVKLSVW